MAGYDRPRGPRWPALGPSDDLELGPPRRGGHYDDEPPGYGAFPGDYGVRDDRGVDDWWADEDDYGPDVDDWDVAPEPVAPGRGPSGGRDGRDRDGRRGRGRKGGHRKGNILWRWRRGLFVAVLLVMAMVAAGVSAMAQVELPDPREMALSSFICTAQVPAGECSSNTAMAQLSDTGNREYIRLDDVPQVLIDAVIATEDRQFYHHDGIDPLGIARALYRDLRGGGLSQGGSTITQQFVKNTYLQSDRTMARKLEEAVLAIKVEQEMSKDEILEGYLNTIYWGRNALGLQAASRAYFGIDVTNPDFGLAQASYLAALIRAPERADANDPAHADQLEEATRRRTTVLDAMLEVDYIDQAQYDAVEAVPVNSYVAARQSFRQDTLYWGGRDTGAVGMEYVTDYVQSRTRSILVNQLGWTEEIADQNIVGGGLRIYTTIDQTMQTQAYQAVFGVLQDPARDPSAGMVAIDSQGFVRAMVGGRDYFAENGYAQNNFATMGDGSRQVGSTFKPIALALAAKESVSFLDTQLPAPSELELNEIPGTEDECDPYTYSNYRSEDADTGNLNLVDAVAESSNTAFAGLMYELGAKFGPDAIPEMAEQLGMNGALSEGELSRCLPTVLGSGGSSPLEMAEVYSTFANRGMHREPTIITRIDRVSPGGDVTNLWRWRPDEQQVLAQQQADLVNYALEGVIDHGTGTGADIGRPAAGKTGTTSDNKDAWFVGYVPQLTAAVWVGYPEATWTNPDCNPAQTDDTADDFCRGEEIPPMRSGDGFEGSLYGHSTITGGSLPARIWAAFMSQATANLPADDFVEPSDEMLEQGEELGDLIDVPEEFTTTTLAPNPDDTRPGGPDPTISIPPITIDPPDDTTTTSDPANTTTTQPDGGGGGGGRP